MKAVIEINTDNAAFEGDLLGVELGRILADIANKAKRLTPFYFMPGDDTIIRDINGNRVGFFKVERGI